jgi:hypothetical protein
MSIFDWNNPFLPGLAGLLAGLFGYLFSRKKPPKQPPTDGT